MKTLRLFFLLFLTGTISAFGQSDPVLSATPKSPIGPVPVDPAFGLDATMVKNNFDAEQYWKKIVTGGNAQSSAWLNYYKSVRYNAEYFGNISSVQPKLDSIDAQMLKKIPGTFEQQLVHYWNGNHNLSLYTSLEKAQQLNPADPELMRQIAGYNYIKGDNIKSAEIISKWKSSGDMPATLLPYAYNTLQSVPQNAVLITNGEFDTYPIIFQQEQNNVRTDVNVLCISLASRAENRALIFRHLGISLPGNDSVSVFDANYIRRIAAANPTKKIYVASSTGEKILSALQSNLYVTGLAFRYSTADVDNLAFLRDNVISKMRLDDASLQPGFNNNFDTFTIHQLNLNYVLPLTLAAQQCDQAGDKQKAQLLRDKARKFARLGGKENELSDFIGK